MRRSISIGMMKNIINSFSKNEKMFMAISLMTVSVSNLLAGEVKLLNFIATIIGVVAVMLCAKGNVWGQILIALFSVLYGIISLQVRYWGELATYMGMAFPMAIWSVYTWIKHPSEHNRDEVEIRRLDKKNYAFLCLSTIAVTGAFFCLLKYVDTPYIAFSTISITTSFIAAALTMLRSSFYGFWYAMNDLVLIILWGMAAVQDHSYIPVVVNFIVFFLNDMYGFYSWKKREKLQMSIDKVRKN